MKYLAAYVLARLGGAENPDKELVKKIIESAGCNCDDTALDSMVSALSGKGLDDVIAEGMSKLSVVGGGSTAPTAAPTEAAPAAEAQPEKKEEEEVEVGGFDDLFG